MMVLWSMTCPKCGKFTVKLVNKEMMLPFYACPACKSWLTQQEGPILPDEGAVVKGSEERIV